MEWLSILVAAAMLSIKICNDTLLQVPNCTTYTSVQVDLDLLINKSVTDPQFVGLLTFSLPTDKVTEVTVTFTDINGIDLVFQNIPISE